MNRNDLIDAMAASADIPKSRAILAFNALIDSVTESLAMGENVTIVGFGTFTTAKRSERVWRHPSTGERFPLKAMTIPRFRPGKNLKEAVQDAES